MSEINLNGLEKFLTEFQNTVKEAKEIKEALELILESDGKSIKENAEKLRLRIEANLKAAQKVLEPAKISESEKKELVYVYEPHKIDREYKFNDRIEHLGKLYRCKKNKHKGSYEHLPQLDNDIWEEINFNGLPIVQKPKREFFARDKTYRFGDEVIYYNKPYKFIGDKPISGISPDDNSQIWKLITD